MSRTRRAGNFGEMIGRGYALAPDHVAIEHPERSITYEELEMRTRRAARVLAAQAIGRGDRVAILMPNDFRFLEVVFATMRMGAIPALISTKLAADATSSVLDDCDPKAIVADTDVLDRVPAAFERRSRTDSLFLVSGFREGARAYDELLEEAPADVETVEVAPDDIAIIMYTSGSTGKPKGCLFDHRGQWWQARRAAQTMFFDESDRGLVNGPLYHAGPFWDCTALLYGGSGLILRDSFEARATLETIRDARPTYMAATPAMLSLMLRERDLIDRGRSSLRVIGCGSAKSSPELQEEVARTFGCQVAEGYGSTEAGYTIGVPLWGGSRRGSIGLPLPDVEARIVDANGADVAAGGEGELYTRCPGQTCGYLGQASGDRFVDGWLRTSDIAVQDADGFLYMRGRADDMINCGGENVYPAEVERLLIRHDAVVEAAVVGLPHAVKGEVPVAFVVLEPSKDIEERELKQYCLDNGPAYAHPRRLLVLDALPLAGTGKVDKTRLTAVAAARWGHETLDGLPEDTPLAREH